MSGASQMFKFTQLRPVNGIDILAARKNHIPLYEEGRGTSLLKSIEKEGLPKGLIKLGKYITSNDFIGRVNDYESFDISDDTKALFHLNLLVLILQKSADPSETEATSSLRNNHDAFDKIVVFTKDTGENLGIDLREAKSGIEGIDIDTIRDDCYTLLLQSAYFPEYRRFVEVLYRVLYISQSTGIDEFLGIYFPDNIVSKTKEQYATMRLFLTGRILLPNGVHTEKKPLPKFNKPSNDSSSTVPALEAVAHRSAALKTRDPVKGASFAIRHLVKEETESRR